MGAASSQYWEGAGIRKVPSRVVACFYLGIHLVTEWPCLKLMFCGIVYIL